MINVKVDSRKVEQGDIFVCIKGHTVDGHDYVESAIKNGATKIISEKALNTKVDVEVVPNSEKWLEKYLVSNYAKYFADLKIIGVTGTNGKTTTCYLTYQMLNKLGLKSAYIGTIGFQTLDKTVELANTTPNILEIYNMLIESKEKGYECVVMEVSSHALALGRVEGINFSAAGFTNLTQDHLDFHDNMEKYLNAKLLITEKLCKKASLIVNVDVPYHEKFLIDSSKTLGIKGTDYKVNKYDMNITGTDIDFEVHGKSYQVHTNLTALFNVYNYMMAVALSNSLGFNIEEIVKISDKIQAPVGRAQIIKVDEGIAVIDYAHTPDALEKIIASFKEIKHNKIITIIGCGGDRDPKKRPIMGNIATTLSDYVIFTNDNPRTEDENKIMEDIIAGVKKDNYEIILDRKKAIKKSVLQLEKNDILLILGKGHEDYQIIGHEKIHLSDVEEVKKALEIRAK